MGQTIAITNQKGGVGKTTTVVNMAVGLCKKGNKILLIDMDAQCNLSYVLGISPKDELPTVFDLVKNEVSAEKAVTHFLDIDVISGDPMISSIDHLEIDRKEYLLQKALSPIKDNYDYIIIDGPPTLGLTTINILTASDTVIVPVTADMFSLQGLGSLYNTVSTVKQYCQPELKIDGILVTRYKRGRISKEAIEVIKNSADILDVHLYSRPIRETKRAAEAICKQSSIVDYDKNCKTARDYMAFIEEFLRNNPQKTV